MNRWSVRFRRQPHTVLCPSLLLLLPSGGGDPSALGVVAAAQTERAGYAFPAKDGPVYLGFRKFVVEEVFSFRHIVGFNMGFVQGCVDQLRIFP